MRLPIASGLFAAALTASHVTYAQSTGLEDMVGTRAGQAEGELLRRGYRNVGGSKGDDRSYTYWWNANRRQCVTIATMNGRYDSITPTTAPDCNQPASNQPANRPRPGYEPDPAFSRPVPRPSDQSSARGGDQPIIDGRPVDLGLVCFGDGTRNGISSETTWTWNAERDRYEHNLRNQSTTEIFEASLMIQIWSDGGRIRLPRALIPPINSRGNQGWWELYDVVVSPDTIRATYRLNGLNKPRLVIDRRSGRITVQGTSSYGFRGSCDVIGQEQRRF